ncbi:MAG: 50S ribosomal protein L20 [Omnitrophica WOR_2 bacterium RIFCSPHIGHO2_01_FULL_48_9]|nr:MAG: 50S ribosomal protein L20 [Omnitrophica WOR_2 bacterium RIFCSPHIGHO2_02_FULL_48_11]OGX30955.1 MAG: 50S ribosomal protein L20 [Omnitrophica WOR_2 bacterium RIFCSPHIGHO2_01_FULL_48_9]
MVRVKHAVSTRRRKKRLLKRAKGQFAQRSKRYRQAQKSVDRALVYSYRDRKVRKREFRSLWVVRINAACRENGMTYSRFIKGLINAKVEIDRKQLAELAVKSPAAFKKLVEIAQATVPAAAN